MTLKGNSHSVKAISSTFKVMHLHGSTYASKWWTVFIYVNKVPYFLFVFVLLLLNLDKSELKLATYLHIKSHVLFL